MVRKKSNFYDFVLHVIHFVNKKSLIISDSKCFEKYFSIKKLELPVIFLELSISNKTVILNVVCGVNNIAPGYYQK